MASKTAGLVNFTDQLTAAFPNRELPDGWIGDEAHQDSTSSHNPDDTKGSKPEWEDADSTADVRAVDVANDFGEPDVDGQVVVDHLVVLPNLGSVIRYMIHDGLIYHVDNDFAPDDYAGSNPHREHIHVTFAFTEAADDNTTYDYRFGEIMGLSSADKTWITGEIRRNLSEMLTGPLGDVIQRRMPDGTKIEDDNPKMTVGSALEYGTHYAQNAGWRIGEEVMPALARIESALTEAAAKP